VELAEGVRYAEALDVTTTVEENIMAFYASAAEASRSLMADVPRTFEKIAKKKGEGINILKSILLRN
jgi:hypothetical protein